MLCIALLFATASHAADQKIRITDFDTGAVTEIIRKPNMNSDDILKAHAIATNQDYENNKKSILFVEEGIALKQPTIISDTMTIIKPMYYDVSPNIVYFKIHDLTYAQGITVVYKPTDKVSDIVERFKKHKKLNEEYTVTLMLAGNPIPSDTLVTGQLNQLREKCKKLHVVCVIKDLTLRTVTIRRLNSSNAIPIQYSTRDTIAELIVTFKKEAKLADYHAVQLINNNRLLNPADSSEKIINSQEIDALVKITKAAVSHTVYVKQYSEHLTPLLYCTTHPVQSLVEQFRAKRKIPVECIVSMYIGQTYLHPKSPCGDYQLDQDTLRVEVITPSHEAFDSF